MKVLFAAAGLPVGPYVVVTPREWEHRPGRRARDGRRPRAARSSSSPPGRVERRHHQGHRAGRPRRRDRAGAQPRPEGHRGGGRRGPRDRVRGAGGFDGGGPEASVPARDPRGRRHEFYDFEAKYLDAGHPSSTCPPTCPTTSPSRCARWPSRPSTRSSCEGLARVDFFLSRTTACSSTRSTRCRASRRCRCSRGCGRRPAWTTRALVDRLVAAPRCDRPHRPALTPTPGVGQRACGSCSGSLVDGHRVVDRAGEVDQRRRRPLAGTDCRARSPRRRPRADGRERRRRRPARRNQSTPSTSSGSDVGAQRRSASGTPQRSTTAGSPHAAVSADCRRRRSSRGSAPSTRVGQRVVAARRRSPRPPRPGAAATRHGGPRRSRRSRSAAAQPRAAGRAAAAARRAGSEVDDRAGQRAGDAVDALDLRDDQLAELVDVAWPRRARSRRRDRSRPRPG